MGTKGVIAAVGLVGVAAGVALAWKPWEGAASEEPLQFESAAVDKGSITSKVTATGTLSPRNTVQVGAQVSGRIAELMVDFNSPVTKNQVIAKLDTRLLDAQVSQATANLAVANANESQAVADLRQAELTCRRQKQLRAENLNSQAELDASISALASARAQVAARKAQVAQAEASLLQANTNVDFATIHSPVDGVVLSRAVDVGQTVAASLQAPVLFTIAESLESMRIDTNVAEGDVGKIKDGMDARFTVDAYPGKTFPGKVLQVRNAPTTVSGVVTYNAVIEVKNERENGSFLLKPGMTANVTFVAQEQKDVVRVPNSALRFRPSPELKGVLFKRANPERAADGSGKRSGNGGPGAGGNGGGGPGAGGDKPDADKGEANPSQRTVWKITANGIAKPVKITVGLTDGTVTELTGGELAPGDQLVVEVKNPPKVDKPARIF